MRAFRQAFADHLLRAGAGAVLDPDDGCALADRGFDGAQLLPAVDDAERASQDGEVLGSHADRSSGDGAESGDDAVGGRDLVHALGPAVLAEMGRELAELAKASFV